MSSQGDGNASTIGETKQRREGREAKASGMLRVRGKIGQLGLEVIATVLAHRLCSQESRK